MALRWDFKQKAGTITEIRGQDEIELTLYEGNAFLIATYEYTDDKGVDMYNVQWFFIDDFHAKRCLGLEKNAQGENRNIFDPDTIPRMTIYRENCRGWKKIVDYFTRAFPHINIMILDHAPEV